MTPDDSDTEEHRIVLNQHDLDHLNGGQPVFKGIKDNVLLVLEPTEVNENVVPIEELEALADEWEEDAKHLEQQFAAGLLKHKALELRELLEAHDE